MSKWTRLFDLFLLLSPFLPPLLLPLSLLVPSLTWSFLLAFALPPPYPSFQERDQEKELAELKDELTRTKKSGEESADKVVKLSETLRQAQRAREKARGEADLIKQQTENLNNDVKNQNKEIKSLEDKARLTLLLLRHQNLSLTEPETLPQTLTLTLAHFTFPLSSLENLLTLLPVQQPDRRREGSPQGR